jgi:hypothetical protein
MSVNVTSCARVRVPQHVGHALEVHTALKHRCCGAVAQRVDVDPGQPNPDSGSLYGAQHVARIERVP